MSSESGESGAVQEPVVKVDSFSTSLKLEDVRMLISLLKTVSFSGKLNLVVTRNGIFFAVEEGKYIQASVMIRKEVFQGFSLMENDVFVKISFSKFLECLAIFCSDVESNDTTMDLSRTSLKFVYRSVDSPFEIMWEGNGTVTVFQLKTEDFDDLMEFELDVDYICDVEMKSDRFHDVLTEFDSYGFESLEICVVQNDRLQLSARGVSGLLEVIIPAASEIVESFESSTVEITARYRLAILKYALKALQIGQPVSLKISTEGILSLSFILSSTADADCYLNFYILPRHNQQNHPPAVCSCKKCPFHEYFDYLELKAEGEESRSTDEGTIG